MLSMVAFVRLRLAEIVLAGKYRVASGADLRRPSLYSSYVKSLLLIEGKHSEMSYQMPFKFMEILRKDLETTHVDKLGSPYIFGSFRSIAASNVDEVDVLNMPASFRHFALAYGQYEHLLKESQLRTKTPENDLVAEGKGKGKQKKMETTSVDEPSLLLTAVFGPDEGWEQSSQANALLPLHDVMVSVPIISRSTARNVYRSLPEVPRNASIPLIFSSTIVFKMDWESGGFRDISNLNSKNFELLARLVIYSLEMPNADTTPLNFVFLLQTEKDHPAPAPAPQQTSSSPVLGKRVPEELHQWITSPMKDSHGELIFPKSGEPSEAVPEASTVHPCGGVTITESHHTTLKTLVSYFLHDRDLFERFCELVPDEEEISGTVLNEQSEVFANCVSTSVLDDYKCTRVVASDGLVIDARSDLCFRLY